MPSAEKVSSEALKIENAPLNEQKTTQNAQKDVEQSSEKTLPAIQQALTILTNKIRNLEKRKNKLDGYIKEEESGKELSSEQKKAVLKYEEVVSQLGISKEFCKQFQTIANAASKEAKREARKAAFLRQMQETSKVREVIMIQDLLRQLKNEVIRNDFLDAQNGACLVEAIEMDVLEQFSKQTTPVHPSFSNEPSFSSSAKAAADHLSFVVDGRNRQFMETGFTYERIKELVQRIQTCGYFQKDIKIVEVEVLERADSATPQTDDLECKDEKMDENGLIGGGAREVLSGEREVVGISTNTSTMPSAPLPNQVPNPTQLFNGNMSGIMPVSMQPVIPQQVPPTNSTQQQQQSNHQMKTTVTAVENAFYNQMKYSQTQGPMINNNNNINNTNNNNNNDLSIAQSNRYVEDFASANISFLQDSLVDQNPAAGSQQQQQPQQKIPPNLVNQPKHSPIQQQQQQSISSSSSSQQTFTNQSFHPQQQQQPTQQQQTHHYPPGLKLQNTASNIPVNFSQQQQPSQTQQVTSVSIPQQQQQQHLISKQAPPPSQQSSHPSPYPNMANSVQYPQKQQQQKLPMQNLKDVEQTVSVVSQNADASSDKSNETPDRKIHAGEKDANHRNNNSEWNQGNQQQPQIDTWNNDTSTTGGNSQTGNYSRFNRNRGSGSGSKYNNYRNSQQSRNNYNNENGSGDSNRESGNGGGGGGPTTFFRNNERYNNSGGGGGRYNNSNDRGDRGNFKRGDDRGNYRTGGSGRFSSSINSQGNNSNPTQRK